MLSLPLLPLQGEDSSHSAPAPVRVLSPGRQSSKNMSNMGPSYGLQLFRNRLLQHGSPMGSQALPANLLQCWLLPPQVCRSWQKPAPAWTLHNVTASFRNPLALSWCPTQAASGYLLHHGPPWTAGEQPVPPWFSPRLHPSFFTDFGVCRVLIPVPNCKNTGCFLFKYVALEALPPSLIGSAFASSGSVFELAGIGSVRHGRKSPALSCRSHPCNPPCYQNLSRKPTTDCCCLFTQKCDSTYLCIMGDLILIKKS